MRYPISCLALILTLFAQPLWAEEADLIVPFVGDYRGVGVVDDSLADGQELSASNLDVSIRSGRKGFSVGWVALMLDPGDDHLRFHKRPVKVSFESAGRPGVFKATGKYAPGDDGSTIWARITGGALVIYQLAVDDDGFYTLSSYRRTLTETGLDLVFVLQSEGTTVRSVTGELQRVEG